MIKPEPKKLVEYIRTGLVEQEHFGYIVYKDTYGKIHKYGNDNQYPFYLRSCAKPLQAALIIDYELDTKYNMTEEEIAICCASHAGEKCHVNIIQSLIKKFGISEAELKCGKHSPISRSAQYELLISKKNAGVIHNNCSGKHTMMLGLCKLKGWNRKNYDKISHPLQQAIINKISELCNLQENYPITKDGCGVPIMSMPLENILNGYINLFCSPTYEKIKTAFLNNPYIIGGENRTDTKIIQSSQNIIAKVGAGGLCVVINTQEKSGFVVKVCDANMDVREFICIDVINKLGWGNIELSNDITTLHGDIVGQITPYYFNSIPAITNNKNMV